MIWHGYNNDVLKEYVPALVFTMYDGYYIYSPYTNTLDATNKNEIIKDDGTIEYKSDAEIFTSDTTDPSYDENATYHENERISGLKPYIYYSCRYIDRGNDFIVTYSLDNYIAIQGEINGNWVNDAGYLLDNIEKNGDIIKYRGVTIEQNEELYEYIYDPDLQHEEKYQYIKINGVKYYYNESDNKWFSILNNVKYPQDNYNFNNTTEAIEYYKDAYNFKQKMMNIQYVDFDGEYKTDGYGIASELTTAYAVNEDGSPLYELNEDGNSTGQYKFGNYQIFDFGDMHSTEGSIEDPNSNFNQHRLQVIRYCIEKELSIAIANYNNYSDSYANFQMPKLNEEEWEKIIKNVSIISFLQGLSIGGKMYNGYAIITNSKNQEAVQEDSIYILTGDNEYHKVNDRTLLNEGVEIVQGFLNIDFEIKTVITETGETVNYMPQQDSDNPILGSYTSIVNSSGVEPVENYYEYVANLGDIPLARKYFTSLGRERYSLYRTNNNPDRLKEKFGVSR